MQSTDDHEQFWLVSSMAARMAFGIGLHLPRTSEHAPDERSKQLLRRVWHGCVLMDRVAALTFGRSILIHECEVPLPMPSISPDPSRTVDHSGHEKLLSTNDGIMVFVETSKLFRIFHQALTGVRKQRGKTGQIVRPCANFEPS